MNRVNCIGVAVHLGLAPTERQKGVANLAPLVQEKSNRVNYLWLTLLRPQRF